MMSRGLIFILLLILLSVGSDWGVEQLKPLFADWKRLHPSTLVLSENTGYRRSYDRDPYSGYQQSRHLYFPVFDKAPKKYHPKEKVLGLVSENIFKAYPFIELNKQDDSVIRYYFLFLFIGTPGAFVASLGHVHLQKNSKFLTVCSGS